MLKEASMNISMTGNTSSEVLELMAILKNAGLDTAHLVTDMDINEPMPDEGDHMCPACAAAHSMDTPCGEAVEEEYANSPDEEYQDDSYMLQDLSGGLNRKKDKGALRAKDPAITYEQKLKAQLKKNLYEKYEKLDEFGLDDLQSGWNKAKDTVSGWFNGGDDNQQAQTTQKKTAAKPATKKKQRSHADAMKDMNDRAVANLEKQIQKAKTASPDQKFKINQNGQILELTPEQYQNYHEQQRDFIKAGNHVSDIGPSKYGEFMNKSLKIGAKNKGDEDAEKQDQTQAQKVSATDDNTQQSSSQQTPPADNTQAATGDPELSGGTTNPQAGPPPTPTANQQAPDSGGPGDGWMANADTDVRNKNINVGAKPAGSQAPTGQAAPKAPAGQAAPKAPAGGQPRPKNVSQARQQARLRATKKAQAGQAAGNKAADRGKAAAAAINAAGNQGNAAGNQGNAAQNVPQEVMNVTKQAIDALQKHGMSAGNIINLISSFAK